MRALLVLLFVLPAIAGCVSDDPDPAPAERVPLSQPFYGIASHEEAHFTGTTGIQLYIDWLLPDGPGPFPTILAFTPYQGMDPIVVQEQEGQHDPGAPYSQSLVDRYVPRGYAVAFADVRGNHEAGGCIDQTGPEQWQDGYDYVQWIAERGWSDGNVGMWGASYVGETQFTTAMMQPPALKTIVPVASVSNQYDWNFYNGVPYLLQPTLGMGGYLAGSAQPSSDPDNAILLPEKLECQDEAMAAGLDFSGDNTTFWQERDYRPMAHLVEVPTLHIHGLRDWNVRPVHIDPIFNGLAGEKRAIFGQWGHAYPDREDWEAIEIAWYDFHLKGLDNGIMDILPPVLIEDDQDAWWGIDDFPPRQQQWLRLNLTEDGGLRDEPVQDERVAIFDLPWAANDADDGPEWSFVTEDELRFVGRPRVEFTATTDGINTHWVAILQVDGAPCQQQAVCQNHGYQDTRHRNGMNAPQDITPMAPYRVDFEMYPQYDVIPAGSTVRLQLMTDHGDIMRDAPTGGSVVYLGGDEPATLHLPLAPLQDAMPEDGLVVLPDGDANDA